MIPFYLLKNNLNLTQIEVELAYQELEKYLNDARNIQSAVWSYPIPELGEGGTCSLFGHLQDKPFELSSYLKENEQNHSLLSQLNTIVEFVYKKTSVDWFGIYTKTTTNEGPQLLKLAYYGAPSRPLFPINNYFAKSSNNTRVFMHEVGCVINNVQTYVAKGGEYYTCDPKVKSECCLPIYNDQKQAIGIIDAEAFSVEFFTPAVLKFLVASCKKINQILP